LRQHSVGRKQQAEHCQPQANIAFSSDKHWPIPLGQSGLDAPISQF
jgi:hypothetical protein